METVATHEGCRESTWTDIKVKIKSGPSICYTPCTLILAGTTCGSSGTAVQLNVKECWSVENKEFKIRGGIQNIPD
jgi:hypothetical protein